MPPDSASEPRGAGPPPVQPPGPSAAPKPGGTGLHPVAFRGVVMGGSLGGAHALSVVLAGLPAGFPLPLVAVLHRAKDTGDSLIELLARSSALPVREAHDKECFLPGHVYLAPPDYHLLVEGDALALSTDAPVCAARPSVDVLFESAADAWGPAAIAVVLTGGSADGAQGLEHIKRCGGVVLVQDPGTAACRRMPEAALAATPVDQVAPLEGIAPLLIDLCRGALEPRPCTPKIPVTSWSSTTTRQT